MHPLTHRENSPFTCHRLNHYPTQIAIAEVLIVLPTNLTRTAIIQNKSNMRVISQVLEKDSMMILKSVPFPGPFYHNVCIDC